MDGVFLRLLIPFCPQLEILLMPKGRYLGRHVLIPHRVHASHILGAHPFAPVSSMDSSHGLPSINARGLLISLLPFSLVALCSRISFQETGLCRGHPYISAAYDTLVDCSPLSHVGQ